MQGALVTLRPSAKPCSATLLIAACCLERRSTHHRFAGVGPAVRVSFLQVVFIQVFRQARYEILDRSEFATPQELARQNTKPQFHLIQPRSVPRHIMKHMAMIRIAQERSPCVSLCAAAHNET